MTATYWKPSEIIVHSKVEHDAATQFIIRQCAGVATKIVDDGKPTSVVGASEVLQRAGESMIEKILAGKQVMFLAPASIGTVDQFTMPDDRILCPHFDRLKLASNGCFYQCDWCYLKLTYRAAQPYITVRVEYDKTSEQLEKVINHSDRPVIFNSGELADSLALEHLTGAARKFIPWFGATVNGYLYMLTKSDDVDDILDLPHNGHTIVSWSINNAEVSRKFEIGAPPFARRLIAAEKVQSAGYPLRLRLDPIVPYDGWREGYAETIEMIFDKVTPERMTIGTLRFEKGFYDQRNSIFTTGPELPGYLEEMLPMFEPRYIRGRRKPLIGKYSFREEKRVEIFEFIVNEIRKHSDCGVTLCKESASVWQRVGMDSTNIECACRL